MSLGFEKHIIQCQPTCYTNSAQDWLPNIWMLCFSGDFNTYLRPFPVTLA